MTASPAADRTYQLLQFVKRYDIEELLKAASASEDWKVISEEESKNIESQGSKQQKSERLASLIANDVRRVVNFANFILRYNSPVQDAALAVISAGSKIEPRLEQSTKFPRHCKSNVEQQCASQDGQSGQKSSVASASPMEVDSYSAEVPSALDHPLRTALMADSRARLTICDGNSFGNRLDSDSQGSMDTDSKSGLIQDLAAYIPHVNLCSQDGSSSSQETQADVGYCSDLSKEVSQNQSGNGCVSVQPLQDSLSVSRKNHRSRQKMLKPPSDNSMQYQQKKTQNVNVQIYNISAQGHNILSTENDPRMLHPSLTDKWPPQLRDHCPEIVQRLNMEMLTTHLVQNKLLTRAEYEKLDGQSSCNQSQYFVLTVLPNKGPSGFKRFLKCLEEENEHLGHQELFQLLTNS